MKADPNLWNQSVDHLIGLLRQNQALDALPAHETVLLVVRLEAFRMRANEDFAELMALREQMNAQRRARNSTLLEVEAAVSSIPHDCA